MAKSAYNPKDAKKAADAIAAAKKRQAKWTKELAGYEKDYQEAIKAGDDVAAKAAGKDKARAKRNINSNKKTIDQKKEILSLIKTTQTEEKAYAKILLNQSETTKQIIKNLGGGLDMKARGAALARVENDITSKEYQVTSELLQLEKEILGVNSEKKLLDYDAEEVNKKLKGLKSDIFAMDVDIASAQEAGDTDKVKELQEQQKGLKGILHDTSKIVAMRNDEADMAQASNALQDKMLGLLGTSKSAMKGLIKSAVAFGKVLLANPIFLIAAAIVAILVLIKKFVTQTLEVRDALKASVGQAAALNKELMSARIEGFFLGYDAIEIAGQLQDEFGTLEKITGENVKALGQISARLGMGTEETTKFVGQFMRITGLSFEAGINMADVVGSLAMANKVAPGKVMEDIAANTEVFAAFGKDGGNNIARAAVQARKLGVSLETSAKMADSLLDFESSIEKEMEASMLIGKQLNYNKARELALSGDLEGATKDIVKQLGGAEALQKMNVLQRRALADSIGVTVDELNRLATGKVQLLAAKDAANTPEEKLNQILIGLGEALTKFTLAIDSFVTGVQDFVQKQLKALGELFEEGGQLDSITTFFSNAFETITTIYEKVQAAISGVMEGEGSFAEKIGPALVAGLKAAVKIMIKALPGLVTDLIFGITDLTVMVADLAGTVVIGLVSAIVDEIGKAFGVQDLGAKVKEKLTWMKDFFLDFIEGMVNGFIIKLAEMAAWISDKTGGWIEFEGLESAGIEAKARDAAIARKQAAGSDDKSTPVAKSGSGFSTGAIPPSGDIAVDAIAAYIAKQKDTIDEDGYKSWAYFAMRENASESQMVSALQAELAGANMEWIKAAMMALQSGTKAQQQESLDSYIEFQKGNTDTQEMLILLREISRNSGQTVTEVANLIGGVG